MIQNSGFTYLPLDWMCEKEMKWSRIVASPTYLSQHWQFSPPLFWQSESLPALPVKKLKNAKIADGLIVRWKLENVLPHCLHRSGQPSLQELDWQSPATFCPVKSSKGTILFEIMLNIPVCCAGVDHKGSCHSDWNVIPNLGGTRFTENVKILYFKYNIWYILQVTCIQASSWLTTWDLQVPVIGIFGNTQLPGSKEQPGPEKWKCQYVFQIGKMYILLSIVVHCYPSSSIVVHCN